MPLLNWVLARQGILPEGFNPHRTSVSPTGELHFLLVGDGANPDVTLVSDGVEKALGPRPAGYTFDVFPDGRICIADFPSKRDDNEEQNAVILAPDGAELVRFHTGYGYEDIQIGQDSRIWVSYFDEGVFSGGDLPSNGLNAFSDAGKLVWQNDQTHRIDDCYALNVSQEGVWYCAYRDFDLRSIGRDGETTSRRSPISGAHAFAIHNNRVLFANQYREAPAIAHLASLTDKAVSAPQQVRLVLEDEQEIMRHCIKMRGGFVHAFSSDAWYRGHLSEL